MHQLLDFCVFGPPGAAPSIDTSMHGLLDVDHVDHLHPDSVIALAAPTDGEELTKRCYGDEVALVPVASTRASSLPSRSKPCAVSDRACGVWSWAGTD